MANGRDSGGNTRGSSGKSGRNTRSLKTAPCYVLVDLMSSSLTSARSGMMRNGIVSPLPPLALPTGVTESGLWPTLTRGDRTNRGYHYAWRNGNIVGWSLALAGAVGAAVVPTVPMNQPPTAQRMRLLPTLTASDATRSCFRSAELRFKNGHGRQLPDVVGGTLNPTWAEWFMGYPTGWTELRDLETPSSRKSRKSSSVRSTSTNFFNGEELL